MEALICFDRDKGFMAPASCFLVSFSPQNPALFHQRFWSAWLKVLREDNRFIFTAAAAAQKAVDYIMAGVRG